MTSFTHAKCAVGLGVLLGSMQICAFAQGSGGPVVPVGPAAYSVVSISSIANTADWACLYIQQDGETSMSGLCAWGANVSGPLSVSGTIAYCLISNSPDGSTTLGSASVDYSGYNNGDGVSAMTSFLNDTATLSSIFSTPGPFDVPSYPYYGSGPVMQLGEYTFSGIAACSVNP